MVDLQQKWRRLEWLTIEIDWRKKRAPGAQLDALAMMFPPHLWCVNDDHHGRG